MSRKCEICGKGPMFGGSTVRRGKAIKHGGIGLNTTGRSKRVFYPNLQSVKMKNGEETVRVKACTSCIKAGKTLQVNS